MCQPDVCRPRSGLRLFVDGLMEVGDLSAQDREAIEGEVKGNSDSVSTLAGSRWFGPVRCDARREPCSGAQA